MKKMLIANISKLPFKSAMLLTSLTKNTEMVPLTIGTYGEKVMRSKIEHELDQDHTIILLDIDNHYPNDGETVDLFGHAFEVLVTSDLDFRVIFSKIQERLGIVAIG